MNELPDLHILEKLLICKPEIGSLIWKTRTVEWFDESLGKTAEHKCNAWNAKWAGKEAFTWFSNTYLSGSVLGIKYKKHRIIWKMHYKSDPTEIDHINGIRTDNRIVNLREVNSSDNKKNRAISSNNTSGQMGVIWDQERNKWQVRIESKGIIYRYGRYKNFEDAVAARKKAEIEHGFHQNHGREQ